MSEPPVKQLELGAGGDDGVSSEVISEPPVKQLKLGAGGDDGVSSKNKAPEKVCNLSTQKFSQIVSTSAFVDKTLFIKTFLEAQDDVIVVVAPRKFCKSTNMDMVKEFLLGNKKLFEDHSLKIYEEERDFFLKNCKKNAVIYADFKTVGGTTLDEVHQSVETIIQKAYQDHAYLIKKNGENWAWSSEKMNCNPNTSIEHFLKYIRGVKKLSRAEIIDSFWYLSRCLNTYYEKKVYVLIDEYDTCIIDAILKSIPNAQVLTETINLIGKMMSHFLKGNEHVERALIAARVGIGKVLSGDANNIIHYEFLRIRKFAPYFGFTVNEVKELFQRKEFVAFKNDGKIKDCYSGYRIWGTNDYIYNSYSILAYLKNCKEYNKKKYDRYWVDSDNITNMEELFARCGNRELIEKLVSGDEIEITRVLQFSIKDIFALKLLFNVNLYKPTIEEVHLLLQFLSDYGYLNIIRYDSANGEMVKSIVNVPNAEIKTALKEKCYNMAPIMQKYQFDYIRVKEFLEAVKLVLEKYNKFAFLKFARRLNSLFNRARMPANEDELYFTLFTMIYNADKYVAHNSYVKRLHLIRGPTHHDMCIILGHDAMVIKINYKSLLLREACTPLDDVMCAATLYIFKSMNIQNKIWVNLYMYNEKHICLFYKVNNSNYQTVTCDMFQTVWNIS